jgi:NADH-quinone oxidoreductase subunit N
MVEGIDDLSGLARSRPLMALAMLIFMFSMAGVPPAAGFFGKLYVFIAAVNAELYALAVIGVLTSVVSAYYYLRIVKVMYFDEPAEAFERHAAPETQAIMAATALFTAFFILWPSPLVVSAGAAAVALLP